MLRKYIIEREVPGIGDNPPDAFCAISRQSNAALDTIGAGIQWLESFVVTDKTYCVYLAADESLIHEHARRSGFPANRVVEVRTVMDPATAAA